MPKTSAFASEAMPTAHSLRLAGLALCSALSASACVCPRALPGFSSAPSLWPVDASRPKVVFEPISGEKCGKDAAQGALRDLDRYLDADGYVGVELEGYVEDDVRCVKATARPFRYGTCTDELVLRSAEPSQAKVLVDAGAMRPCSTDAATGCASHCSRIAALFSGEMTRELKRDRCEQGCAQARPGFEPCIAAAQDPAAADACFDAPAAAQPAPHASEPVP